MTTTIAIIQSCPIFRHDDLERDNETVTFIADADIDCDGCGGNPHHDPYFQPDTRLHHNDQPLHAETVPYVVVPPIVLQRTRGRVLGSLCELTNLSNGKACNAVVGDSGPRTKIGEISPAAAEALGLSGNPNHGGTSERIIKYQIHVDLPAIVNGILYDLQQA